ncbi:MAG: hypothetical protein IIV23_08765 [Ruminococcus sp.]|nr:hypothetical protein [Ruminococcus sp.]
MKSPLIRPRPGADTEAFDLILRFLGDGRVTEEALAAFLALAELTEDAGVNPLACERIAGEIVQIGFQYAMLDSRPEESPEEVLTVPQVTEYLKRRFQERSGRADHDD